MKDFLKNLVSEKADKKWYEHKALIFAAYLLLIGLNGYFNPDGGTAEIDFSAAKNHTWSGLGLLALTLLRHFRSK